MKKISKAGFTLIELLVVVLIIGILATVALPQYQKAVEKSRSVEAITLLRSVYQAAESFYLANGTWPTQSTSLDIEIPWSGTTKFYGSNAAKSSEQWSIQFAKSTLDDMYVSIGIIKGPYKGAGFIMFYQHHAANVPLGRPLCREVTDGSLFEKTRGDYCQKIMNYNTRVTGHGAVQYDLFS